MSFVHLHNHTEYSLLDGMAKVPELLKRAKELGMEALAITDHGSMAGAVEFYLKAHEAGIKPIIGCEVYMAARSRFDKQPKIDADQYHLVLLAKNQEGYKNLLKLVTLANLEGFYYKPRIDFEILEKHSSGLIALSACLEGEIPHFLRAGQDEKARTLAKKLAGMFGFGNFYLEIQNHPKIPDQDKVNKKLIELARELGLPLVATNDCHYILPEDAQAQEILLCVQTQKTLLDKDRPLSFIGSPDFYLKNQQEMQDAFLEYPEALKNTLKIAQECNLEIETGKWVLPHFSVPKGETADSYLQKLCWEGIKKRYSKASREILDRLEYELSVIMNKKYSTYFLIVQDFVNWAKNQGIMVGPGRGSVAGSLSAYVLGITEIDPLEYNLPFERFLNPQRPSPPDVDLDFADDRRDEVIEYVTGKYGKDRVAQIITFGSMEARQAIRDVGRVLGMPYSTPDRVAKLIPLGSQGMAMTIDQARKLSGELEELYQKDPEIKRLLDLAQKLEGVKRHASTHAAGIVISDRPLIEYVPLQKEVKGEKIITQYDMYSLDLNVSERAIGLLKMDFLGLRNLSILEKARKVVEESRKIKIDFAKIPRDDKDVFWMISQGETTGVFQLESAGMRRLARDLKPSKISDLSAMVALYRPGPMEWISDFIESKTHPSKIKYPHLDLKPILEETYGIAVYQEQCLQIANQMAGYSLAEADNLRRAIGKKKMEMMKKEKIKFMEGAQKQGYSTDVAGKVFSLIEKFAGYGFNKAHSASYALIAYYTAYMKTHYPVEFMTAVLTAESHGSGPSRDQKLAEAVAECKRMKIEVLPPDLNQSETGFSIEQGKIRFGLSAIKNVGEAAIFTILEARKECEFKSLEDFCRRVDLGKVNRKTLESLIKAGAMDSFGRRMSLLKKNDKVLEQIQQQKRKEIAGQASLFRFEEEVMRAGTEIEEEVEIEEKVLAHQKLLWERQLLGFYLTEHPAARALGMLASRVTCKIADLYQEGSEERTSSGKVTIGGIIAAVRKVFTRVQNHEMAFVKIEDETGVIEIVVFPQVYAQTKSAWVQDNVVLVTGNFEIREDRPSLIVESAVSEFENFNRL